MTAGKYLVAYAHKKINISAPEKKYDGKTNPTISIMQAFHPCRCKNQEDHQRPKCCTHNKRITDHSSPAAICLRPELVKRVHFPSPTRIRLVRRPALFYAKISRRQRKSKACFVRPTTHWHHSTYAPPAAQTLHEHCSITGLPQQGQLPEAMTISARVSRNTRWQCGHRGRVLSTTDLSQNAQPMPMTSTATIQAILSHE